MGNGAHGELRRGQSVEVGEESGLSEESPSMHRVSDSEVERTADLGGEGSAIGNWIECCRRQRGWKLLEV